MIVFGVLHAKFVDRLNVLAKAISRGRTPIMEKAPMKSDLESDNCAIAHNPIDAIKSSAVGKALQRSRRNAYGNNSFRRFPFSFSPRILVMWRSQRVTASHTRARTL
jgi:hypothetical protein